VVVVVVLDQKQIATVTLSKCPHTQSVFNCQQLLVPVRKEQCLKEMAAKKKETENTQSCFSMCTVTTAGNAINQQ
jgi:hypothetical protein